MVAARVRARAALASHVEAAGRRDVRVALVTPEDEPLLLFGEAARDTIRKLLDEHEIALHTGYSPLEFEDGELGLLPARSIEADSVIALPSLSGQRIDGVPQTRDGFVPVDRHGRVDGLPDVYAAGDITRFPVKQGGLAAQQADAAAEAIAAAAGAAIDPQPFRPILRGLLLTGDAPRYLRRDVAAGEAGTTSVDALWWPPAKLVGRRLAPFLARLAGSAYEEPPAAPGSVVVERELGAEDLARAERRPFVGRRERHRRQGDDGRAPDRRAGGHPRRGGRAHDHARRRLRARRGLRPLIRIVTSRDLLRAFAGRIHSSEARVREWMTAEPISVSRDAPLAAAAAADERACVPPPARRRRRACGRTRGHARRVPLADRQARAHIGLGF